MPAKIIPLVTPELLLLLTGHRVLTALLDISEQFGMLTDDADDIDITIVFTLLRQPQPPRRQLTRVKTVSA